MVPSLAEMSARSKFDVSWTWIVPMPSTISPTRPDSSRAVSWRSRPSRISRRRMRGITTPWHGDDRDGDRAQPEILDDDEDQRRRRLAAEQRRLHEGVADEAAERLDLVLDHGGDFGALDALEDARREPQDPVDELEADAPEHPLAEPSLEGVDVEFEQAVDDDQQQEDAAQRKQHAGAVELNPGEQVHVAEPRQVEAQAHEGLGGARLLETLALDRAVDDLLGQVERHEVGDHRHGDDEQDPQLLAPGMLPDIAG